MPLPGEGTDTAHREVPPQGATCFAGGYFSAPAMARVSAFIISI